MKKRFWRCLALMLLVILSLCGSAFAASNVSIIISSTGTPVSIPGGITVAFSDSAGHIYTETVPYGQFSSPASLASWLAASFTSSYLCPAVGNCTRGLGAQASGAVVTFQLNNGASFEWPSITNPSASFTLSPSSWPAAAPVITWATPAAISYGVALNGMQLDATASVLGTLVYTPTAGTVLSAGSQTLSVTFTPTDTTDYTTATATVTLTVNATLDLEIVSPTSGAIFSPGQTIPVSVSSVNGTYTSVVVVGTGQIGFSSIQTGVPAQFSITLPSAMDSKTYTLTAVGVTASGQNVYSAPITIGVEQPDVPNSIASVPSSLTFESPGGTLPISLLGKFPGGTASDITLSSYTTYSSLTPAIATVSSSGVVTPDSPGQGLVTATYTVNGQSAQTAIPITVEPGPITPSAFSLSFSSQAQGTSSPPQELILTSTAQGPLSILSVTASINFSETDNCLSSSPLGSGATCTVEVVFTPSGPGARAGNLTITDGFTSSPLTITLNGTGQ